jgi:excisionase family DNA binding protein
MDTPHFYVYVLSRPDGRPFYVGKGKGRRVHQHESEAARGHNCHKCNIIRKIWRENEQVHHEIVFTTDDESEAFDHEMALIGRYGRQTLANLTNGGEGPTGLVMTPAQRAKVSAAARRMHLNPDVRRRISQSNKARFADPAQRAWIGLINKVQWADQEIRTRRMANNHNPDGSLSIEEAAARLEVSPATIRRRIKTGEIGAYKRTTVYGFEWRILLGEDSEALITSPDQNVHSGVQTPDQDVITPTQPADGIPEAIKALTDTIEHLREDHRAEVERLERDKEALRQAAEHWQARYLEGQEKLMRLLPAPVEEDEPAEVEQQRPWWKFWGKA